MGIARNRMRGLPLLILAALATVPAQARQQGGSPDDPLWHDFQNPPAEARPMMRWWWFGPAVTDAEIDREIRAMKAGGIGGFEVQAVYPMAPDGGVPGLVNRPFLSDAFIAALRHAGETARAEGMRIDVTGGSGWPFGGPHIPVTQAAAAIRMQRVPVPAGATMVMLPAVGPGETVLSAAIGPAGAARTADRPLVPLAIDAPRVPVAASAEPREALVFVAGRTGQQVKRAALGAEGYVLDHVDPAAVANHLETVGDRLMQAFAGAPPPDAFFSDSLEAYGSSWTGDLPAEFRRRRGYDLMAHLSSLFLATPESESVRFDWALTLSELVDERYLRRIDAWAKARGMRFRAQVYGFPPPTLSSNALVALPEGEGADWRSFTSTRWATSGAHLYGKPVASSEVWTWLHSPSWAATPLDMKVEADRHFLQGVTQLIGHGWPYTPPGVSEPGWAFYAAAALNDHNPWYAVMHDVSRYLQRVSHLLRQGEAANQVAIYLPIEDAFAAMTPDKASANETMHERVSDTLVGQVLDAGQGFDFVDAGALRTLGMRHKLLVLPRMTRIDPDAYAVIAAWVARGGKLVVVDALPGSAGGLRDAAQRAAVQRLTRRLASSRDVRTVPVDGTRNAIGAAIGADMRLVAPDAAIGFVHRRLATGDVYFIANTGNRPVSTRARFAGDHGAGEWWDPMTGARRPAGSGEIALDLAPYQSRLLVFANAPRPAIAASPPPAETRRVLADGWTFAIGGGAERPLARFASWADDPAQRYTSGTAIYRRTIRVDGPLAGRCVALDLGAVRSVAEGARASRPVAAIDAPVRDAAIIIVNGERIGSLWAPPYRLDISRALKSGNNRIEVRVANTALNALAGRPRADLRLLHARYGERFTPQDQDKIVPHPSGLIEPAALIEAPVGPGGCQL
ncbi:hypothetical protein FHS96_001565 [Sphingomonas zeicaulis]|uniref:glycosyl hydrolase n=1 Tax=Sphingomonas zeicaulis TaxID=1632740 RepID=UPI003D1E0F21